MRALIALEIVVLLVSAGAAWDLLGANAWDKPAPFDYLEDRVGELDREIFVTEDPAARAARGEKERALGVALAGYDELLQKDPSDTEAFKGQLRTTLRLGAAAAGQQGLGQLVFEQAKSYMQNIRTLDPDGAFLRPLLREWCTLRMGSTQLYDKASVAIWLAARNDEDGLAKMREFVALGPFHHEFLPYAERFHPAWPAVEPLLRHYLEKGDLLGRVAAGSVLLEYHYLYGIGKDLYDKHLESIRAAFKEIKGMVGPTQRDTLYHGRGDSAIFGMAMLANRGFAEEKRILAGMTLVRFPHNTAALRIAQVLAGNRPFADYMPGSESYKLLSITEREMYYRAAAHLAARRLESKQPLGDELDKLLDYGFHSDDGLANLVCWRALATADADWNRKALEQGNLFATVLIVRKLSWPDQAARLLRYIAAPQPDYSALAVVALLDLGDTSPVQPLPGG